MKERIFLNKAFTLIEILVVVLIIGILAAIAVPQYQKAVWTSRYSTIKDLTKSIIEAEEVYFLRNGEYTTDLDTLDIKIPQPNSSTYNSNKKTKNYFYDWGKCRVRFDSINSYIECILFKDNISFISYEQHPFYGVNYPSKRFCASYNNSSLSDAICKKETGKSSYIDHGPDQDGIYYNVYLY